MPPLRKSLNVGAGSFLHASPLILLCFCPADLNSPLLFGRLNGLSSDSTVDILYQMGTTQDAGTKDRYQNLF